MAVQSPPYALQNAAHSAALFRQATSAPFISGGIIAAGELAVTQQGTPNMSVILGAGRAEIVGTSVSPPSGLAFTTQANYFALNDANVTLTIAASNPTNPRIDAVYLQVQDSFYSGASNLATGGVVTGTPAASPTAPAVPSNSILLAYVAVAANATTIVTGNISYQATVAAVTNTPPSFATITARSAFFPTPSLGQQCYMSTAPLVLMAYNGTRWQKAGLSAPTSQTTTGGTSVINDDGSVTCTFTGAGNVILNGVFALPALYDTDDYDIEVSMSGGTANSVNFKLTAGGVVDASTTNYDWFGQTYTQAGTVTPLSTLGGANWGGMFSSISAEIGIELRHAASAVPTYGFVHIQDVQTLGTAQHGTDLRFDHRASTVWDGIQIIVVSACTLVVKVKPRP